MNAPTNTVNFPSDIAALRSAVKRAIEYFQGSPVNNLNKLNEAIAAGLGYRNYDQLSAALNGAEPEPQVQPVPVTFLYLNVDENRVTIGDDEISPAIFDNELVNYVVKEREDLIDSIIDMISHARGSDKALMRQDIQALEALTDRFVFSSVLTNEYVAASTQPVRFNEICAEICTAQRDLSTRLATDQLFELIINDEAIQASLESAADSSPRLPWGVLDIAATVKGDMNIELDTDDTALLGRLLSHFNAEQKRLLSEINND